MPIDKQLWYARVGLYNINNNCRCLLRTRHNTSKIFCDPFNWDALLTVFFIIEMLIIFVFTWSVHYNKAHFLNRKNLFTSQTSMYKEQNEVAFPSGIFIFARILLFFFFYLKMRFQGEYLRILLLIRSGDIETNPGPKKQSCLKFFHWNLNGLAAHNFIKLPLIESYITINNFDIVSLSETYLDSIILNDDHRISSVFIDKSRSSQQHEKGRFLCLL